MLFINGIEPLIGEEFYSVYIYIKQDGRNIYAIMKTMFAAGTSCVQVHELPQNHCGIYVNIYIYIYICILCIMVVYKETSVINGKNML